MVAVSADHAYTIGICIRDGVMTRMTTRSRSRVARLFRNNRSQAVRIPAEFELPGDRVLIHREGRKLIIEPVGGPRSITELLAEWRKEEPLGSEDQFPEISDLPVGPEDIL